MDELSTGNHYRLLYSFALQDKQCTHSELQQTVCYASMPCFRTCSWLLCHWFRKI